MLLQGLVRQGPKSHRRFFASIYSKACSPGLARALVVKENYDAQKKLTGVTAMLKLDGYDQADRNWVMAAYKPDGQVVAYGKVQACIACHAMVTQQDFVFAPPPAQLLPVAVWKAFFPKQQMSPQYVKLLDQHPEGIVK